MHSRGFAEIQLVQSIYGWGVRYASGLDGFGLIAARSMGNVDGSFEDAVAFARSWFDRDPIKRVVSSFHELPAPVSF